MSNKPLISIIIPIYKVEKYLQHCLETVKRQTYENIEVLLINDGSPDQSSIIAKRFSDEDQRFHYFEKENGGLSSARNYGIERSSGEYISFIDSDDWVEECFIEHLLMSIQKWNADIAICNMKYIYPDGTERMNVPTLNSEKCVSNIEALQDLFNSRYYRNHAQNKLYRAKLFKDTGIRYPDGKLYEDVFTTYKLFYQANYVSYLPERLYDYLQARPGSILNSGFSDKQLDIFDGIDEIKAFLIEENIYYPLSKDFEQLAVSNILAIGNFIYRAYFTMDKSTRNDIRKMIRDTQERFSLHGYIRSNNLAVSQKLRYYMMLHGLALYSFVMKVLRK